MRRAQQPGAAGDAGRLRQYVHRETGRYYAIWIQDSSQAVMVST